jgi:hypothetical protein
MEAEMRYRQPFTLFPRQVSRELTIFYHNTYDTEGNRTTARSTGQSTVTATKHYCTNLQKNNKLIPVAVAKRVPMHSEFGATFWVHDKSEFLKYKEQRGYTISNAHAKNQARYLQIYIEPALGKNCLDQITGPMVET